MTLRVAPVTESKHSLTDQAYVAAKRKILSLELPPGAAFTEAQISAELSLGEDAGARCAGATAT